MRFENKKMNLRGARLWTVFVRPSSHTCQKTRSSGRFRKICRKQTGTNISGNIPAPDLGPGGELSIIFPYVLISKAQIGFSGENEKHPVLDLPVLCWESGLRARVCGPFGCVGVGPVGIVTIGSTCDF